LAIYILSKDFAPAVPQLERPLFATLSLFAIAFIAYLAALRFVVHLPLTKTLRIVIGFAIAFRVVLLFSEPIQEVDIYRYLWDGLVSNEGVSPFEYAPQVVVDCQLAPQVEVDLRKLVVLRDRSPGIQETLSRVHFSQLPTVYPPVSQAVFAVAAWLTPDSATVETRAVIMKAILLLFDLGVIFFIARTVQHAGLHPGWSLAYAWCPLVMKEFANSGHLDSIAVCLSAAAIYFAVIGLFPNPNEENPVKWLLIGAVFLALAVGAKLYPVSLAPILAFSAISKVGWKKSLAVGGVFLLATTISLAPMLTPRANSNDENVFAAEPTDRQAGLKAFLSHWMMNDLLFLNVIENLTPNSLRERDERTPWFVIMPNEIRETIVAKVASQFRLPPDRVPFVLARIATACGFVVLASWFAWLATGTTEADRWLELVFLTVAWFWLLLPTLNPWYWIWSLPWIAFAKNRVWLALSGLLFLYYLRFYFEAIDQMTPIFGSYPGVAFFDFVVVWFEYVPWILALLGFAVYANAKNGRPQKIG